MTLLVQLNANSVQWEDQKFDCHIGWRGFSASKVEGDGCTPIGTWKLDTVYYRPDKISLPESLSLPFVEITKDMVWCDDPNDIDYNTCVHAPYSFIKQPMFSHEKLWREDDLYDLLITTNYNTDPVIRGMGSAIFIHQMHDDSSSTAGCLALHLDDLLHVITSAERGSYWILGDYLA